MCGPDALLAMLTPDALDAGFWLIVVLIYYFAATLLPIDKVIGKINKAWIEDQRGYAEITFDSDAESEVIYQKVKSGTLKGVSVGYMVEDWEEVAPNKVSMDGRFTGPCSIAKRWIPYEISIVSVPADPTVGVGRSMTADEAAAWNETYARQLQYNKNIARGGKSR